MPLPRIDPYPMPAAGEIPPQQVTWEIEPHRAVLLIHDMQNYFLAPFTADRPPANDLVHNVRLLRTQCAALDIPVVYTAQPGSMTDDERGLLKDFWGPGMTAEPEHRRIIEPLAPASADTVFVKWRYSAFHRTGLLDYLRSKGRDQLIICGVYAHVGCLMTACDAFSHDIQPHLVADAVADFSADDHRMALTYAAQQCAATPTTRQALLALRTPARYAGSLST